jgi:hypothetical protein
VGTPSDTVRMARNYLSIGRVQPGGSPDML